MFSRRLPNSIFRRDVVLALDGISGYSDAFNKVAYTPHDVSKGVEIKSGVEILFNGINSYVECGNLGLANTFSFWVSPDFTDATYSLIDLNGSSTITIASGNIATANITSPTVYVNGAVTNSISSKVWSFVVVTTETQVNVSDCNIGLIGSSYFSGSMTNILFLNKVLDSNQIGQLYGNDKTFTESIPSRFLTIQKFRKSTLASAQRIRMGEQARNYIIIRNLETSNVAQVGFTTANNNNTSPATTFTDIAPGQEWYETGSTNQVWFRPKVDGQSVLVEIEVSVPRA